MEILNQTKFDAILLDLILPDSKGIDTLVRLKEKVPNTPIIIQTVSEDENIIVKAFQMGAHGYLRSKNLDANLLIYAIRLAVERQLYVSKSQEIQQQKRQELEFQGWENLANPLPASITARMFASESIRESLPVVFNELVQQYSELLDLALEERVFKIDYEISEKLRALADKLGFIKGSPRDVIDIHTKVLKEKNKHYNLAKVQAYVDEGRLRLLELMGYLTSYYRKYYIGLSNLNIDSN